MKTETQTAPPTVSQPGNLSVRELAKSLTQTAPATAKPTTKTAESGTTAATREGQPPEEGTETETAPDLSTTETETEQESTEGTETEATAENTAEETAAATDENTATEATEEAPAEQPAKAELPEELKDAMEIAKADGKKGTADLLKRVHKLVDERDTARNARLQIEEQNAQLRTELTEARERGTKDEGQGTMTHVHPEVAKVVGELNNVDHWLGWCEQNPDGGELPDGKGGKLELDPAHVKAIRGSLERERSEIVARKVQTERDVRVEYNQAYQKSHTEAVALYPWLKNSQAPENQEFQTLLKAMPWVKQAPTYEIDLADYLAGKALRLAKAKATPTVIPRKVTPSREPTRVLAEPPASSAQRKDPAKAKKEEADTQFKKSGSTKDLAKSFAANRRASRTGG